MSRIAVDNLSNEKIQQLLAAVGARSQEDTSAGIETSDFDWRQPRFFNIEQFTKLEAFAEQVTEECVDEFSRLYHTEAGVSVVSTGQCYWHQVDAEDKQDAYFVAFGVDPQKPFGLMSIPHSSAAIWAGQVLGGGDSTEDSDRELSKLEESFLLDIASGLVKAVSKAYGGNLQLDQRIERDKSAVELQESEELFMMTLEVRKSDSDENTVQASFLFRCDQLRTVAGKVESDQGKMTPSDNIRAMREYVHDLPVSLTVQLAKTTLLFKDVMDLRVDDIVVLNKKVTEPVDVLIGDKTFFCGRPAQSGGKHAVVIA